ncbi:unnamed protein product [Clavelina lepadiformis]|uniref:Lysosomal cobalamin transporter n=1 Tax=Clavelina lepadiformis TaxID=159417 RepID=A0ABP0GIW7_CLALP
MSLPQNVTLAASLPFPAAALVTLILATFYFWYYKGSSTYLAAFVSIGIVVVSSLLVILIPIDVYLLSSTKEDSGLRKSWATNETIHHVETTVFYGYNGLYAAMLMFMFLLVPFTYFSHPPQDAKHPKKINVARGFQFSSVSFVFLCLLLIAGGVVQNGDTPSHNSTIYSQINYVSMEGCFPTAMEHGMYFVVNCLGIIGAICCIVYTAYGMAILPINLIKGKPIDKVQRQHMDLSIEEITEKLKQLTDLKAHERPLSEPERRQVEQYSQQLLKFQMESDSMRHRSYALIGQCDGPFRCIQAFFGVILYLLSLLIVIVIVISNSNRLLSSTGMYSGYILDQATITNPVDILLQLCHEAYPLDYILLGGILCYIIISTLSGMQHMGMWLFWLKLHHLRPRRSTSRALVFSAFVLAVVTIYSGVLAYSLAPQYVTYGTQKYLVHDHVTERDDSELCSTNASTDKCIMTVTMQQQTKMFYRIWVFGVAYYWCSWLFVLAFITGTVIAVCRMRKTVAQLLMRDYMELTGSEERLV